MAGATAYPAAFDTDAVLLRPDVWFDDTDAGDDTLTVAGVPHQVGDLVQYLQDTGARIKGIQRELGLDPSASFADVAARLNAFTTVRKTADQTNTTITPANATDLVFPVVSGVAYTFEFRGVYSSNLVTAGIGIGVTTPTFAAGDLTFRGEIGGFAAAGAGETFAGSANTSGGEIVSTAVAVINTLYPFRLWGTIVPTASGSIQFRFRAEVAATITLKKAAHGMLWTG